MNFFFDEFLSKIGGLPTVKDEIYVFLTLDFKN